MAYSNGRSCAHRTAGQAANHSRIDRGSFAAFIMATALAFLPDDGPPEEWRGSIAARVGEGSDLW
jgi:hypothetical protein